MNLEFLILLYKFIIKNLIEFFNVLIVNSYFYRCRFLVPSTTAPECTLNKKQNHLKSTSYKTSGALLHHHWLIR
jgi:hypothetical protein